MGGVELDGSDVLPLCTSSSNDKKSHAPPMEDEDDTVLYSSMCFVPY